MDVLRPLYAALPACYLRARAAFAMALEMLQETGDSDTCERLVFECLFILDQSGVTSWLAPALAGELGFQVGGGALAESACQVPTCSRGRPRDPVPRPCASSGTYCWHRASTSLPSWRPKVRTARSSDALLLGC